jgi:hypothetical protein
MQMLELHAARRAKFFAKCAQVADGSGAGAGSGATSLVFADKGNFFNVHGCSNIAFEGFSVDMERVPYTSGTLLHFVNQGAGMQFSVQVTDTQLFPLDPTSLQKYTFLTQAQAVIGYNPAFERFIAPDVYMTADPCAITVGANSTVFTVECVQQQANAAEFVPGMTIVVRHQVYAYNAFNFQNCINVAVKDVVLYATAGMGVYADLTTDLSLVGLRTERRRGSDGSARPMSINADGIHVCNSLGGTVLVDSCVLEGQGDDGLNVNTPFARITAVNATTTASGSATILYLTSTTPTAYSLFPVSSLIDFYDGRTLLPLNHQSNRSSPLDWVRVVAQNADDDSITVMPAVESSLAASLMYALVSNAAGVAQSTYVRNTTFRNNRARGALVKQPNALVENCTFEGMTSPAIITNVDGCFWMEGRPVFNWTVRNSVVRNVDLWGPFNWIQAQAQVPVFDPATGIPTTTCVPASAVGVFRDITIDNVRFELNPAQDLGNETPAANAFAAFATERVTVVDSYSVVGSDATVITPLAFSYTDCSLVSQINNTCVVNRTIVDCSP